jgi:hypothetical protein
LGFEGRVAFFPEAGMGDDDEDASVTTQQPVPLVEYRGRYHRLLESHGFFSLSLFAGSLPSLPSLI